MDVAFQAFPEVLLLDGTYGLLSLGYVVVFIVCVDGNGKSEICGVFILAEETQELYEWCLNAFKHEHGDQITKYVKSWMTDKEAAIRSALETTFPHCDWYICIFHVTQIFLRTFTYENYKLDKKTKEEILRLMENMMYSKSDNDYEKYESKFMKSQEIPKEAKDYFIKRWSEIPEQWCIRYMTSSNLNIHTNNRLESINAKIKGAIGIGLSLMEFGSEFFVFYGVFKLDRDAHAAKIVLRKSMNKPLKKYEISYMENLTGYAYDFVKEQLSAMENVKIEKAFGDGSYEMYSKKSTKTIASCDSCTCSE